MTMTSDAVSCRGRVRRASRLVTLAVMGAVALLATPTPSAAPPPATAPLSPMRMGGYGGPVVTDCDGYLAALAAGLAPAFPADQRLETAYLACLTAWLLDRGAPGRAWYAGTDRAAYLYEHLDLRTAPSDHRQYEALSDASPASIALLTERVFGDEAQVSLSSARIAISWQADASWPPHEESYDVVASTDLTGDGEEEWLVSVGVLSTTGHAWYDLWLVAPTPGRPDVLHAVSARTLVAQDAQDVQDAVEDDR